MAKVKRYKNIEFSRHHRRRGMLKPILICLAAALLIFVGYSVTGPAIRFFKGEIAARPVSSAVSAASSKPASKKTSSVAGPSSAETASSLRGVYLSSAFLSNTVALQRTVASAKSVGLNLAVVDVKDADGVLRYRSALPLANSSGVIASGAPDPSAAAGVIKSAGLTAGARLTCFADNAGSDTMRDAAVLYSSNGTARWMDQKNQFWLNPYSAKAQQYLINLAKELVSKGFTCIVLDGVQFPVNSGSAYFAGQNDSREQALAAFVANARKQINAAGGKLIVHFDSTSALGGGTAVTGLDQNLYALPADYVSPDFCPSALPVPAQVAGKTLPNPAADPAGAVAALAQLAKGRLPAATHLLPYVQAFAGSGKSYGTAELNAQIAALKQAGFASYLLYNADGSYSLSGLQAQ